MTACKVSIVIPAFNEAERLPPTLAEIQRFAQSADFETEILVVDDGSSDRTFEKVAAPARVIRHETNHGKGFAVRQGMLAATGDVRVFMDADLCVPLDYVRKVVERVAEGYDLVIGSRNLPGAKVSAGNKAYRRALGRVFNACVRMLAIRDISDTQCGFKGFSRRAAEDLFARQTLDGYAFDVEVLFLARKLGYRILQLPVEWRDAEGSRIRLFLDGAKMLLDVLRVRWLHRSVPRA
jgi:dolichyl-phosphate beta-glucosyltransferase